MLSIADGAASGSSQNFNYDSLDRLTAAAGPYGDLTYTYDSAGNRLTSSAGGSTTVYSYSAKSNPACFHQRQWRDRNDDLLKIREYRQSGGSVLLYNQAGRLAKVTAGGAAPLRNTLTTRSGSD